MSRTRQIRTFLGIFGGATLGYIFALDVSGWFFGKPLILLLMEFVGAIAMYRIVHGLMEDERISRPFKRGFIWSLWGLIIAHVINLTYIYLKDLRASFDIRSIDFAEALAMSWAYMHFTIIGFVLGALWEYGSERNIKIQARKKEMRLQLLKEKSLMGQRKDETVEPGAEENESSNSLEVTS